MNNMVVLGASPNPERYSHKAVRSLLKLNFSVVPIGIHCGMIETASIITGKPGIENVHTVLLYISPDKQKDYYEYILQLNPKRIIFNPGTENNELITLCNKNHIEVVLNCALVMLCTGQF